VGAHPTAAIVTIGNELVSGDIANTNGSWLAARLEALGFDVILIAALPDDEVLSPRSCARRRRRPTSSWSPEGLEARRTT
jgi:molybdopterin biosynthesis enzyme